MIQNIKDTYARIRGSRVPVAVFNLRGNSLASCTLNEERYLDLKERRLYRMLGTYDKDVQDGWIEEDFMNLPEGRR